MLTLQRQVETSQAIAGQRIGSALQNDGLWVILFHDQSHHFTEDIYKCRVIDSITEWNIHTIPFSQSNTNILRRVDMQVKATLQLGWTNRIKH